MARLRPGTVATSSPMTGAPSGYGKRHRRRPVPVVHYLGRQRLFLLTSTPHRSASASAANSASVGPWQRGVQRGLDPPFPLHQEVLAGDPRTGVHIAIEHPTDPQGAPTTLAFFRVHDGGYTTESGRSFDVGHPGAQRLGCEPPVPAEYPAHPDLPVIHLFRPVACSARSRRLIANLHVDAPAFLSRVTGNQSGT